MPDCTRDRTSRFSEWCSMHWQRANKHGSPLVTLASSRYDDAPTRIRSHVTVDPETGCWLWQTNLDKDGYGKITWKGRPIRAHRFSYETFSGSIPPGLEIDHVCHTIEQCAGGPSCQHRRCVNPEHLAIATTRVNVLRGHSKQGQNARKTHCVRGHVLDGANLVLTSRGRRGCRLCMSILSREHRERAKAKKSVDARS